MDEQWQIRRPTAADEGLLPSSQTIIEIVKSRMDLWGNWVASYNPDTKLYDQGPWTRYTANADEDPDTQPQTAGDRVRMWFEGKASDEYYSLADLCGAYTFSDVPQTTLKSAITNLVGRGVLEKQKLGPRNVRYRAVSRKPVEPTEEAEAALAESAPLPEEAASSGSITQPETMEAISEWLTEDTL